MEFIYTYVNIDSAKGETVKDEDNSSSSVQRAFSIIRALAATQAKGGRITHVAKATGLTQATTHRILQSLVAERVVEQEAGSKLYRLSIEFLRWPRRPAIPWTCAACAGRPCCACAPAWGHHLLAGAQRF